LSSTDETRPPKPGCWPDDPWVPPFVPVPIPIPVPVGPDGPDAPDGPPPGPPGPPKPDKCIPEPCGLGFTVYPYIQPQLWGHSYDGWETCGCGLEQSPINIRRATKRHGTLHQHYGPAKHLRLWNNGHSLAVRGNFGSLYVDCCYVPSVQFDFHTPSEHRINNRSFDMEMHIVHSGGKRGQKAAVAILFKVGPMFNRCLASIFRYPAPRAGCDKDIGHVDIGCFFDKKWDGEFFEYSGSETTPPCEEGVKWFVRKTPVIISRRQLHVLKTRYVMNARPVQPLNNRSVYLNFPERRSEAAGTESIVE